MTDLLLIFLGAAYLDNLVLMKFFDVTMGTSKKVVAGIFVVAGLLLVLAAALNGFPQAWRLPPQATAYLHALAFMTTVMTVAQGFGAGARHSQPRLRRLRNHLPLLVANLAVLAFALLDERQAHGLLETAGFCLAASLTFYVALVLFSSLRERLEVADIPQTWRGTPIALLTAGLMSLALMGYVGSLPW